MANVWKIGSRWSDYGSWDSRIISVFRRSSAVFLGNKDTERFYHEVKCGDYFAIADGYCIPSVAKAVSDPMPLNDMIEKGMIKVRKGEPFDITDDYSWCYGVKVKIVDLPKEKHLYYEKRGTFFKADSIAESVISLFEDNLTHQFDIQAHTYRIKPTHGQADGKCSIIDQHTFFNIPVYQREYSWGREEVSRFVSDILKGFWGNDDDKFNKTIIMEPLFIGTMQLSYKKYIKENEFEQDVIDGQQRLSTILCILKFLKLKYTNVEDLNSIKLDWLETRVNNGKEDFYLSQLLSLTTLDKIQDIPDYPLNRYLQNIQIIKEVFEEKTIDDDGKVSAFFNDNIRLFVDYFLNCIYFVVVETLAGLSKTIQIFNTINTAGLDLSGDDLFKVRFYEYLHDINNQGEEAFNEIGNIYKEVKDINSEWRKNKNWDVITIGRVRSIYKYYIISKYRLNATLYSKSTDTFFDELFDTLLNVQTHKDMVGIKNKNIKLSLDDLRRIIKVAYLWNSSDFRNADDFINYTLIERSRYPKYTNIAYQILLSNENLSDEERLSQVFDFLKLLAKLFFCYSVMYAKAINEIHSFMHELYRAVINYNENKEKLFDKIQKKILSNNNQWFRDNCIGEPIAYNRTWKNLICILSDYFDEIAAGTSLEKLENLYGDGFDIEHIHANANEEEGNDIDEDMQNSIGNLMLLEYDINRSIGCLPFKEKKDRSDGKLCYKDSQYATVNKIRFFDDWGLSEVEKRHKEEVDKIANFLFNISY